MREKILITLWCANAFAITTLAVLIINWLRS